MINLLISSKAIAGSLLPPSQISSWHNWNLLSSSLKVAFLRSLSLSPRLNLNFGSFPYLTGISAITFFSLSIGSKARTLKADFVFPAITVAYFALMLFALPNACSIACLNSVSVIPSFLHSTTRNGVFNKLSSKITISALSLGVRLGTVTSISICLFGY